jgi:Pyruvate/2-oxoacid:ferredoxin oxidoreductase gamma subunit
MKVIIAGTGGYGVKFLGTLLGKILMREYNVVVFFDYDAASRGGDIISYVVFSNDKIGNPTIDEADLLLKFDKTNKEVKGKEIIEFNHDCKGFKPNMVGLGLLLNKLGIRVSKDELRSLITKDTENNIKGVELGLNLGVKNGN